MVGSSRRGGVGVFRLVGRCSQGGRRGRDVVVRDRWLRLLSLRGYEGEAMGSEIRLGCLVERPPYPRGDQREMAWVEKDRWLRLLSLLGYEGEEMDGEVRQCR